MRTGIPSKEHHLVLDHTASVPPSRDWCLTNAFAGAHLLPTALALLLHDFFFVDYKRNYEKAVKLFFYASWRQPTVMSAWIFQICRALFASKSPLEGRFVWQVVSQVGCYISSFIELSC